MKKAQIISVSCNRRKIELKQIEKFLEGNGYSIIRDSKVSKDADLIIFSSCAATIVPEDSSIKTIKQIQQRKKQSAKLIVCGCLPEINPDRLAEVFDGHTFGPRSYEKLNEILKPKIKFKEFQDVNTTYEPIASSWSGKGKFHIQIHVGCPFKCSYCAIRFALGQLKSKPIDDIIKELQKGFKQGYREFYLDGDCSGSYGLDIGENLGTLLRRILEIDQDFSLALTDISAFHLPLYFKDIKMLCVKNKLSSIYVSIQSASTRILKLMGRNADMGVVKNMLMELKRINPSLILGTSIIIGFPSETEDELNETIEFCEQVSFKWIWCHGFSPRPKTAATKFPGQLSPGEIAKRCRLVRSRLGSKTKLYTDYTEIPDSYKETKHEVKIY